MKNQRRIVWGYAMQARRGNGLDESRQAHVGGLHYWSLGYERIEEKGGGSG